MSAFDLNFSTLRAFVVKLFLVLKNLINHEALHYTKSTKKTFKSECLLLTLTSQSFVVNMLLTLKTQVTTKRCATSRAQRKPLKMSICFDLNFSTLRAFVVKLLLILKILSNHEALRYIKSTKKTFKSEYLLLTLTSPPFVPSCLRG